MALLTRNRRQISCFPTSICDVNDEAGDFVWSSTRSPKSPRENSLGASVRGARQNQNHHHAHSLDSRCHRARFLRAYHARRGSGSGGQRQWTRMDLASDCCGRSGPWNRPKANRWRCVGSGRVGKAGCGRRRCGRLVRCHRGATSLDRSRSPRVCRLTVRSSRLYCSGIPLTMGARLGSSPRIK